MTPAKPGEAVELKLADDDVLLSDRYFAWCLKCKRESEKRRELLPPADGEK